MNDTSTEVEETIGQGQALPAPDAAVVSPDQNEVNELQDDEGIDEHDVVAEEAKNPS